MRLLSDQEKQLCLRILEGHGRYNCISNIIDDDLSGILIFLDKRNRTAKIEFPIRNVNLSDSETLSIIARINQVSELILVIVNLITMLEKEGYILIYSKASKENDVSRFGQGIGNSDHYVTYDLPDKKINDLLIEYFSKNILVTPEFARFCNNGFVARDEQRFKKQIRIAYTALAVALFAAFVNLFFNLYKAIYE